MVAGKWEGESDNGFTKISGKSKTHYITKTPTPVPEFRQNPTKGRYVFTLVRCLHPTVSHCGWNSCLESLWYGVPIATWPLYAEQQINAFQLVHELELAVELKLDYRANNDEIVMADVIERAITRLMDDDNPVRKRVKEMSEKSRKSVVEGGSSYASISQFIEDL